MRTVDVVVIGGGQSALSTGFYLRRAGVSYVLLDDRVRSGGAWQAAWPSLRLFSPAQWSSLPGYQMPAASDGDYPSRDETIAYLAAYETRYAIPVERPVHVDAVRSDDNALIVETTRGALRARVVISATGSASAPRIPAIVGMQLFSGRILHSVQYAGADVFRDERVVVVGGGNSAAQIVAELGGVSRLQWATLEDPRFLPDDVDGRLLFDQATARYRALQAGKSPPPPRSLGDIVMVPSVRAARGRGWLVPRQMFTRFTRDGVVWPEGDESQVDAVIFATGFTPALSHLRALGVVGLDDRVEVRGTRSVREPRLWLVGYGEWTGFASATLIGVGRSARATVEEVSAFLAIEATLDDARRVGARAASPDGEK